MNRGLSLRRRTETRERRTTESEEHNPPVICIDKDEQVEMGLCQSTNNNSQAEERESRSQDDRNCSSPILFPSQEQRKDDEVMKEDDDDCLEIVDKRECTEDTKKIETPQRKDLPSHSRMHLYKLGKAALSLGKKRQVECELNNGGDDATKPKERRLMGEEKYSKIEHEVKPNAIPQNESFARMHPLMLNRSYKCKHKVCQTLEEADKMNLFFAPSGVKRSVYSQVIVNKFESYRQRLYNAQSCLVQYHPYGNPIAPAGPGLQVRRRHTRAKRPSVLIKNTQEIDDLIESNKDTIDLVENPEISKETGYSSGVGEQAVLEAIRKYDGCSDTNQDAMTPPLLNNNSSKQKDVDLTEDNDVVIETKCIVDNSSQSDLATESEYSPIKPRLKKHIRRTILEDTVSDEELPSFSFRKSKEEEKTNEPEESKEPEESQEPERPKGKQESVIVSSKENAPSTPTSDAEALETADRRQSHHECPMCYKLFSEDRIQTHAAVCNGSNYEILRRSAR